MKRSTWILLGGGAVFCLIAGIIAWLYFMQLQERRQQDPRYQIIAIVQHGPQKESIKTAYLAELLNLSYDHPANLYAFDTVDGERRLLECAVVKSALIQKIFPGTLYVQYSMREPIALLGDFANTAVDADGVLFPFSPFFTPKKLPKLFLGLQALAWGQSVASKEEWHLAMEIYRLIANHSVNQIDITGAFSDSKGHEEVVVVVQGEGGRDFTLRWKKDLFAQSYADFVALQPFLNQQEKQVVIDQRIPQIGLIRSNHGIH